MSKHARFRRSLVKNSRLFMRPPLHRDLIRVGPPQPMERPWSNCPLLLILLSSDILNAAIRLIAAYDLALGRIYPQLGCRDEGIPPYLFATQNRATDFGSYRS